MTPKYYIVGRQNGKSARALKELCEAVERGEKIVCIPPRYGRTVVRQDTLDAVRKYVYDQFAITEPNPDTESMYNDLPSLYPTVIEPPEMTVQWPKQNPYLNDRPVLDECRYKVVYGRFSEAKAATTNDENSGQV